MLRVAELAILAAAATSTFRAPAKGDLAPKSRAEISVARCGKAELAPGTRGSIATELLCASGRVSIFKRTNSEVIEVEEREGHAILWLFRDNLQIKAFTENKDADSSAEALASFAQVNEPIVVVIADEKRVARFVSSQQPRRRTK